MSRNLRKQFFSLFLEKILNKVIEGTSDGRRCMNANGFGKNKASSNITVFTEKFP